MRSTLVLAGLAFSAGIASGVFLGREQKHPVPVRSETHLPQVFPDGSHRGKPSRLPPELSVVATAMAGEEYFWENLSGSPDELEALCRVHGCSLTGLIEVLAHLSSDSEADSPALPAIFHLVSIVDPEGAARLVPRLMTKQKWQASILKELGGVDADLAVAAYENIPGGRPDWIRANLATGIATVPHEHVYEGMDELIARMPELASEVLSRRIGALDGGVDDIASFIQFLDTSDLQGESELISDAFARWSVKDPRAAMVLADNHDELARIRVSRTWAKQSPSELVDWAVESGSEDLAFEGLRSAVSDQPLEVSLVLLDMSPGTQRDVIIGELAEAIMENDPEASLRWLSAMSDVDRARIGALRVEASSRRGSAAFQAQESSNRQVLDR